MGIVAGALFGGLFFLWIAGTRVIDPSQFEWLMKLDWRINFLGWHLFRNDPWHLPPGIIDGYLAGEGTTIGLTDSVPLAAFLFKPLEAWLPTPFQYFGVWLLLCFVLQGAFGALLTRLWTRHPALQLGGAALFVLAPTLLIRVGHPALTAHFVLLWALCAYFWPAASPLGSMLSLSMLGFCAGLLHPYLAAMTLAILAALPLRERSVQALLSFSGATVATVLAWWLAGFIAVSATSDLAAGGLGMYSMNLLSPITAQGWSTMLPELPIAHEYQAYEGFQYLGVGAIALLAFAAGAVVIQRRSAVARRVWPVVLVCVLCALYAVSPRVTMGSVVLVDWTSPAIDQVAFFRASGRFFWPMTYLLLTAGIAVVVSRFRAVAAAAFLAAAVALQAVDQQAAHADRRSTSRSEAFHSWPRQLTSPAWHDVVPIYDHVVLVPASQCGGAPVGHEELAYLAGLHNATINSGLGARWNESRRRRYCGSLEVEMSKGHLADDSIYVVSGVHEQQLRAAAPDVVCGGLDGARICVTGSSRARWPAHVRLSE
jgi:hypothetical protein